MAKIIINGNKVFFRHWWRWYTVIGRQAHRIQFNQGQKGTMKNSSTVYNPIDQDNQNGKRD